MTRIERSEPPRRFRRCFEPSGRVAKSLELIQGRAAGTLEFNSNVWKAAKPQLKLETGGKCAYCESPTDTVAHGDVEHYRPKSKYWWLAYCYENYLYACQICNQVYKGDEFPYTRRKACGLCPCCQRLTLQPRWPRSLSH
jgi:hypothetical protein